MNLERLTDEVEAVSQIYAARHGIDRDATWFLLKLQEEVGELTQAFLRKTGRSRPTGASSDEVEAAFASELADVVSHVLLLARHHGIDLQAAVERKWLQWNPDWVQRHTAE